MRAMLVLVATMSGCGASATLATPVEVVEQQVGAAWVFSYAEEPTSGMDALHVGDALVDADGCLRVGDAVVVWRESHLAAVGEIVAAAEAGETAVVSIGGGGWASLAEGDVLDDFPAAVVARCPSATVVWDASGDPVSFTIE